MEDKEFYKLINQIYKGIGPIPWDKLNEEPLKAKFVVSLINDLKNIRKLFKGDLGRKGGISCKNLPISIKIINKDDESPALEKFIGVENQWVVVYFGICPELENYVSITMWPSQSNSSKRLYKEIHDNMKKLKRTINLDGDYYLYPPNEIRPQRVKIISAKKDQDQFYDWPHFPFLKDVGDTLESPISAINYNKVLLRNNKNELYEDYITFRVIVGSIIDMRGNQIRVKIPFFKNIPHAFTLNLRHHKGDLKRNNLYYFLLMSRAGERIPQIYSYKKINKISALAHTISWELYTRFLTTSTGYEYRQQLINQNISFKFTGKENIFAICSINEFEKIFEKHQTMIYRIFENVEEQVNKTLDSHDYIFEMYLSPFFEKDIENGIISYKPPIFKHANINGDLCSNILKLNKLIKNKVIINLKDNNFFQK